MVFVDPLDPTSQYWWPALIVPTDEIDSSMGVTQLGEDEYLVKYFEDSKYSIVKGKELRQFDPNLRPFTDFALRLGPEFLEDPTIKSAMAYFTSGQLFDRDFKWKLWRTGSPTLQLPFQLPNANDSDISTLVSHQHASSDDESEGSRQPKRGRGRPKKKRKQVVGDMGQECMEMDRAVKELEELQQQYYFFKSLVSQAAKDLYVEMGNKWPPTSIKTTNTRFGGKRRKMI